MLKIPYLMNALLCSTAGLLSACAHAPPAELVSAREEFRRASAGPTASLAPAELYKASQALQAAENSFSGDPKGPETQDLAYVAARRVEYAEAVGATHSANQARSKAERDLQNRQAQAMQQTRGELTKTREQLAQETAQLGSERQARVSAEQRAAESEQRAKDALGKLAAVKTEDRGLVITLSGSVLFASDQSTLLPDAQTRLNQVADALMATKERNVIVEGFTDSRGSESHNLDLSQRRAQAVRDYLVSRGYPQDRIQAQGMGKANPVADNTSAEGRANNRRVELVVQPQAGRTASAAPSL